MITAVVATDKNYGIGYNGGLLISIKEDMKHFSRATSGGYVIMGRKTYESLPKRPLKNRINVIITSSGTDKMEDASMDKPVFVHMDDVKKWLIEVHNENMRVKKEKSDDKTASQEKKVSIIGGGQIYKELLPFCEQILITKIFKAFDNVDTYFPNLDSMPQWDFFFAGDVLESDGIKFQYRKYKNLKIQKKI